METVLTALHAFFDAFPAWLNAILAVVSAASAITALTPSPNDDRLVSRILKVIEVLALNVGHARRGVPPATAAADAQRAEAPK